MSKIWKHVKRGSEYKILGTALLQSKSPIAETDDLQLVVYQNIKTDDMWVRPSQEFYDGRFVQVESNSISVDMRVCIGGPADGQMWDAPGNTMNVYVPKFKTPITVQDTIEYDTAVYVKEGIRINDKMLLFWRFTELSVEDCLRLLFTKYTPGK